MFQSPCTFSASLPRMNRAAYGRVANSDRVDRLDEWTMMLRMGKKVALGPVPCLCLRLKSGYSLYWCTGDGTLVMNGLEIEVVD